jgi:DNA repair protein SbcD/Mre11
VRLIHTSDWHLGRGLHGADLLEHQAVFLGWLRAQAVERAVDVVVVAGDVYDRAVPSTDAVQLLNDTLVGFARDGIPVVLTSGNHDSAVRLGFGSGLVEAAGIHVRTRVSDVARPLLVADEHGEVAVYGIPYLLPDAVMEELGAERSHQSVVASALRRIREDAAARGVARTVVVGHAFVAGGVACDSERDLRVGGIGDVPAAVFAGITYVALGHLHGAQGVLPFKGNTTTVRYSGSPLAFSFSEKDHTKAVTLVEFDATGVAGTEQLEVPVPRPLREVRGRLDDLLSRAGTDLAALAEAWVKVVLTDRVRPASPMERLRAKWPHTLVLDFALEGGLVDSDTDLRRLAATADPMEICGLFVEFVGGCPPDDAERRVLRDVVETVQHAEVSA